MVLFAPDDLKTEVNVAPTTFPFNVCGSEGMFLKVSCSGTSRSGNHIKTSKFLPLGSESAVVISI